MKSKINERLRMAIGQDPRIICDRKDVNKHPGNTTQYLVDLGLSKSDLKRLETWGMAVRGYTKNLWLPGETLPSGKKAEGTYFPMEVRTQDTYTNEQGYVRRKHDKVTYQKPSQTYRGKGHQVRWIIFGDTNGNV